MNENSNEIQKSQSKKSIAYDIFDWIESLFLPLVMVVVIMTFAVRVSRVDGESMLPTLHDNDYLIINGFFYQPDYNDIIVLQASKRPDEQFAEGKPLVKRVIGLPGDRIFIDAANGLVYRNDQLLEVTEIDGLLYEDGHTINDYTGYGSAQVVEVPENSVYVLGDNRMNSADSRSGDISTVDEHYIVGKVVLRILPFSNFGKVN